MPHRSSNHEQQVRERMADLIERHFDGDAGRGVGGPLADAIVAAFPILTQEPEVEWGWRSFFGSGEEYEWLACHSREDAEQQIRDYQFEEDASSPESGRIVYSLWWRTKGIPGPWQPVENEEEA